MARDGAGDIWTLLRDTRGRLDEVNMLLENMVNKARELGSLVDSQEEQLLMDVTNEHSLILNRIGECEEMMNRILVRMMDSTHRRGSQYWNNSYINSLFEELAAIYAGVGKEMNSLLDLKMNDDILRKYPEVGKKISVMTDSFLLLSEETDHIRRQFFTELQEVLRHLARIDQTIHHDQEMYARFANTDLRCLRDMYNLLVTISKFILNNDCSIAYASACEDLKQYVSQETVELHEKFWNVYKEVRDSPWNKAKTFFRHRKVKHMFSAENTHRLINALQTMTDSAKSFMMSPEEDHCPVPAKMRRM